MAVRDIWKGLDKGSEVIRLLMHVGADLPVKVPCVVMVSNHWGHRDQCPSSGIFIDRQLASLREIGVRVRTFDIGTQYSLFHLVKKVIELRRMVHELRPDIVHAQYGSLVAFIGVLSGRPCIVSFCGNDLKRITYQTVVQKYLGCVISNVAGLRAIRIICKSEELKKALWWGRDKAVVIANGVDLNLFSPGPQDLARKELGWEGTHPVALFHGRTAQKGLDVVQAAMNLVRSHIPNAELHVVGNVPPLQMPLYYRAADVFICASRSEGSPNMVKEALACNLPVISTPVGDVRERLVNVYPSEIVPRDVESIGRAITRILIMRRRSNGREYVQDLDVARVSERILKVYLEAAR